MVRAICLLPALIGLHRGYIYCNGVGDFDLDYLSGKNLRKIPERKINMVQLGRLLKNGEIKMIFVYGANPLITLPNQNLVREVFQQEDIFIVVHDIFKTETADYADILLPATTFSKHLTYTYPTGMNIFPLTKKLLNRWGKLKAMSNYSRTWQDIWV